MAQHRKAMAATIFSIHVSRNIIYD